MMRSEIPLPMPYSSICSPIHIRKTVPAVIVRTQQMTLSVVRESGWTMSRVFIMYWTQSVLWIRQRTTVA